jgi:hypothetical protein
MVLVRKDSKAVYKFAGRAAEQESEPSGTARW